MSDAQQHRRLAGKVAVVTGGASGIGRATAKGVAAAGAAVVLTDIDAEGLREAAAEIASAGGRALAHPADVAVEDDWRAAIGAAVSEFGRLDVLHNCAAATAAAFIAHDTDVVSLDAAHFLRTLEVNLVGTALGCKHAIPAMLETGGGSIINTSSICGAAGDGALIAYGASKGGIDALTRYVAASHGKQGIRCNAVAPGVIVTENNREHSGAELLARYERHTLTPRLGTPEDVAHVVVFLASDEAAFITGEVLYADGGFLRHFPTLAETRGA
jgi:NAD(P)-dependent dehydrogenase (short-subunit alcohol dehydrogenase family)